MACDEQETSLLALFRAKLCDTDEKVDDYCLLRFLRARSLDVNKAHAQFLDWQKWTRSVDFDNILTKPFPKFDAISKVFAGKVIGYSKQGFPLTQRRLGEINSQAALALITPAEMETFHAIIRAQVQEKMREQSVKFSRHIDRVVGIMDLKGLGLQFLRALSLFKVGSQLDERYFPESVELAFLVNAPSAFPVCWKAVSPFVDPKTKTKIHVLSASNQTAMLLKYIDADQLPVEYGGKNLDCAPHADPKRVLQDLAFETEDERFQSSSREEEISKSIDYSQSRSRTPSRSRLRSHSRSGLPRLSSRAYGPQMLQPPSPTWPGVPRSLSNEPVEIASKLSVFNEFIQSSNDTTSYISAEMLKVQQLEKNLTALTGLVPSFPPREIDPSGVTPTTVASLSHLSLFAEPKPFEKVESLELSGEVSVAITQAFALITAQHAQLSYSLHRATEHVSVIQERMAYIEAEKESMSANDKVFKKLQKDYLSSKVTNRSSSEQLLQEDVKYANEKREVELQEFRLRAKVGELKLSSDQAAAQFSFAAISAYEEFAQLSKHLLPTSSMLEQTARLVQKNEEEMRARLRLYDSVQIDLERDPETYSRMLASNDKEGPRRQGLLYDPLPPYGPLEVLLEDYTLTLHNERGTETISCLSCTVKETREIDRRFVFCIKTPAKTHFLQADNAIDMQRWMQAIQMAATLISTS